MQLNNWQMQPYLLFMPIHAMMGTSSESWVGLTKSYNFDTYSKNYCKHKQFQVKYTL